MQLFTQIDNAMAIVRYPKGVLKQVKLYHRGDRVYIPHGGGFVEVWRFEGAGTCYTTTHPDIRLIDHNLIPDLVSHVSAVGGRCLRYTVRP